MHTKFVDPHVRTQLCLLARVLLSRGRDLKFANNILSRRIEEEEEEEEEEIEELDGQR